MAARCDRGLAAGAVWWNRLRDDPDGGNVYTACMLKNVGTVRLIDPTLPSSNLLSHCTALETQISWNQQGQKGEPGAPGVAGKNGADGANGISPSVTQLPVGDSNCPNGGAAITDASRSTAYVCSGQDGRDGTDGQSFTGSFTSPNGAFSINVSDTGITLSRGSGPSIVITANDINVHSTGTVEIESSGTMTIKGSQVNIN